MMPIDSFDLNASPRERSPRTLNPALRRLPAFVSLTMFRPLLRLQPPLHPQITRRIWTLSTTSPLILAPVVFTGLTLTLWSYKCLMMILFQSRIIYMPGIPLGARTEKISDYSAYCRGIRWKEGKIHVDDGTVLATASATVNNSREKEKELVVVYFQGCVPGIVNASMQLTAAQQCLLHPTASPSAFKYPRLAPVRHNHGDTIL